MAKKQQQIQARSTRSRRSSETPADASISPKDVVIYVGFTPGEAVVGIAKVGYVRTVEAIPSRVKGLRAADRLFKFVPAGAFLVSLPSGFTQKHIEDEVLTGLRERGHWCHGELFFAPYGSPELLLHEVHQILSARRHSFTVVNVDEVRQQSIEYNRQALTRLRRCEAHTNTDHYREWLKRWDSVLNLTHFPPPYLPDLGKKAIAYAYLLRDLLAGCLTEPVEISLGSDGWFSLPPLSAQAAWFEAQAEIDLALPRTVNFSTFIDHVDQLPPSPCAFELRLRPDLNTYQPMDCDVPNAFFAPSISRLKEVWFTPEHLSALGYVGGEYDECCSYVGASTRSRIPMAVWQALRQAPSLLPGVRFWLNLTHCLEHDIPVHRYALPEIVTFQRNVVENAALLLEEVGRELPDDLLTWVRCAWFPMGERTRN